MKLQNEEFIKLLNCNKNNFDFSEYSLKNLLKQKRNYIKYLDKDFEKIYPKVATLEQWIHPDFGINNMHPAHQEVINTVLKHKPSTICEIGAGAGSVTKYVYNSYPTASYLSVEPNKYHRELMQANFDKSKSIIEPKIDVKSKIIAAGAQALPLSDNSVDFIFTCTVMMHIPYLMIPSTVKELSRVSSNYILHVENPNDIINAVVTPNKKVKMKYSEINKLQIDYDKIYDSLGFNIIDYKRWEDPVADCDYVSYLYKKV